MEVLSFLSVPGSKRGLSMFQTYHQGLTYVALFHYAVDANGQINGLPDQSLINQAHAYGVGVLLVLSNFVGTQFNPYIMRTILRYEDVQERLLGNLLTLLQTYNLDGVNLDLENMFAADRTLFSKFVTKLAGRVRRLGKLVTISVPAKLQDEPEAHWRGAFDYAAISQAVDRVVLMTYEEHWAASQPGPVASIPWVNGVLVYATGKINPAKLLLGIPLYGYDWPLNQTPGKSVTYTQAGMLAAQYGAKIQWDGVMQSPHFTYTDTQGTVHHVWYENVSSVQAKVALGQRYGISGIAVWDMKLSFPQFWQYIIGNIVVIKPQLNP
ncbi:MAG: glycosyl hydrolase family 18 protein [Peptococcaceae bacterium]|nr:glycosyl hydrolase family 18 protein [Peptococcaceae bacterium]